ncbi:MAG: hypothetical protein ABWY06_05175 [Pseudomonas sp.]|uniref:hypothetical protein n=1 Tax=Pseudomonas sp. TaxID=306 RepID=UPI00339832E9
MRKKILLTCTLTMFLAGIALAAAPFFWSMAPSAKAKAARSQHDISTLQPGDYRFEPFGRTSPWDEMVLIIKDWDGSIYAHLLPTDKGRVVLPENFWGLGYYFCEKFAPETVPDGKLKKSGNIKCHDSNLPEWSEDRWQWSYNGTSQKRWTIDMYTPGHEIKGNYLYIDN